LAKHFVYIEKFVVAPDRLIDSPITSLGLSASTILSGFLKLSDFSFIYEARMY